MVALSNKTVLVVGGGIAGVSAALDLAEEGVGVVLLEKDDFLGGHAAELGCKAAESCLKCNGCLSEPRFAEVMARPGVEIHLRSRLMEVNEDEGRFTVRFERRPAYIDPARCTDCGRCIERCPMSEEGAFRRPLLLGHQPRLAIDPEVCLYFKDKESTLCRDVCPEEAIDFQAGPEEIERRVDAVVMATGFTPYDPATKPRFGYGDLEDVITAMDLERGLRADGGPRRPSDGRAPKRVAFIQCVGSRERERNNYCSRVCCGYALRLGRALTHRFGCEVTVFYMDIQSFGHAFDDFLAAAEEELTLIRQIPGEVWPGPDGEVMVQYVSDPAKGPTLHPYDLMVLSVGIGPGADNASLGEMLDLDLDEHGFMRANGSRGVFLAGTVERPLSVAESVAHAGRAAREAIGYLRRG